MLTFKKKRTSIWFSPLTIAAVFLYSLLFFGLQVDLLTIVCLILTFPFLPIAYIVGGAATAVSHNEAVGYPLGAWAAVFLQAYFLTCLTKLVIRNFKEK